MNIPDLSRTEISALIDEWVLNERKGQPQGTGYDVETARGNDR